jgi:DNA mismatch endonuclease (patch repair protein)
MTVDLPERQAGRARKNQTRRKSGPPMTRAQNMARIGPGDSAPELAVRRALHASGFRYRLHQTSLPGKPDIVLARHKTVVFVHGCFWHGHQGCRNFRIPKTRPEWWTAKLERNVRRDRDVCAQLEALGWRVEVVWECETGSGSKLTEFAESLRQDVADLAAFASGCPSGPSSCTASSR